MLTERYEDHLYYPMVVGHRVVEMRGDAIKCMGRSTPIAVTQGMWEGVIQRLEYLEGLLNAQA